MVRVLKQSETAFPDPGFGVYVHWPFCLAKCPYCDFNSHVQADVPQDAWRRALVQEIKYYADKLGDTKPVTSIFFGGGTPSLMPPDTVAAVIETIHDVFPVDKDIEISLEANPTSVEAGRFQAFAEAGVNRVSLGVQSLHDEELKFLGREHSAKDAIAAVDIARRYFQRYSFDLIYARPGQTLDSWEAELKQGLSYADGHMSLYQLTIEKGTQFYTLYQRGDLHVPTEEEGGALYELTTDVMRKAGYHNYEVSNYARSGQESRHNQTYWRYGDYLGIGPGAHGRISMGDKKYATRDHRAPQAWLERVEEHGHGAHPDTLLTHEERAMEMLLMGLRLDEPLSLERLYQEAGENRDILDVPAIEQMQENGFLTLTDDALRTTAAGRQRLEFLLSRILA